MRKLSFSLPIAIAIGLLTGASLGVTAQDAERAAPVEVTGAWTGGTCPADGTTEVIDGIVYERGGYCNPVWEMSDPRLDGTVTWATSGGQDGEVWFGFVAHSIENDGGTWRQRPVARFGFPGSGESSFEYHVLIGDGDYAGLVAVLVEEWDESEESSSFQGYIIDGEFPPPPENALAE